MDVQIGPQLYERAPQELRSRLWMALLDNPTLATSVKRSAVRHVSPSYSYNAACWEARRCCTLTST